MRNQYRVGPVYRASLIVSGGMCAGLGIAILAAPALRRIANTEVFPASAATPPVAALGFAACGLALIAIGLWFPRVTSVLAGVTLSMAVVLVAEQVFGTGPRLETLIAANLRAGSWDAIAPNTVVVLLLSAAALLLRHTPRWFKSRLGAIAVLGSIIFAIGIVGATGYLAEVPTYVWQWRAPMSFLSTICASILGLGIVMSACRYSELDEAGIPRWFSLVTSTGALSINVAAAVAYIAQDGLTWTQSSVIRLMPMLVANGILSVVAARQARQQTLAERAGL
jgi:hypothetical protein